MIDAWVISANAMVPDHFGDAAGTSMLAVKSAAVDTPTLFVSVIVPLPMFAFGMAEASRAVSAPVSVTDVAPADKFLTMVMLPNTTSSLCVQDDTGALKVTVAGWPIVIAGTLLSADWRRMVVRFAAPDKEPPVSVGVSYIVKDAATLKLLDPSSLCARMV